MGIDTPLVDAEGFPRNDIDVYRARTLRKRFKEVQTDHRELEKEIAAGLLEVAALTRSGGGSGPNAVAGNGNGGGATNTTDADDEAEKLARLAPKPKPKFDPKSGKWVVKSWDGSVAGVEGGEGRSFDDLGSASNGALSSIAAPSSRRRGTNASADDAAVAGSNHTSNAGSDGGAIQSAASTQQQQQVSFQATTPFAIIDEVSPNSPASEAGLQEGDLLLQFGEVHSRNHDDFRAISQLLPVAASEGKTVWISVRRKTTVLGGAAEVIKTERMELRPRTWGGRGLLGCHIRPYHE